MAAAAAAAAGRGGDRGGSAVEDRLVAALLLRDARARAELAQEEGIDALLAAGPGGAPRINARVLQSEISQLRSHNRRCGVEPLPAPAPAERGQERGTLQAFVLEREYLRSAHQMRQGGAQGWSVYTASAPTPASASGAGAAAPRGRQRVGAGGVVLDIAAAREAEERMADEDAELANPLLRPPPPDPAKAAKRARQAAEPDASDADRRAEERVLWPSKGLRVRIVDETGDFKASHLKKGVVSRRSSATLSVDVELDGSGEVLRSVPQRLLETVVSKACTVVEVIRGPHRGVTAPLIERSVKQNVAVIRMAQAGVPCELRLPLDDVCEFK